MKIFIFSIGYFVKNVDGDTRAVWWESNNAHQIDFTNPEAAKWFSDRIEQLRKDPGIDSFKFDGGETDYAIPVNTFIHLFIFMSCFSNLCINS